MNWSIEFPDVNFIAFLLQNMSSLSYEFSIRPITFIVEQFQAA